MTFFFRPDEAIIVQGMTGRFGEVYTQAMITYGTRVAAGVTPGKGGAWLYGLPVFDSVSRAVEATGAQVSVVAVPAEHASDAVIEAINAGIRTLVCVTEGMAIYDVVRVVQYAAMRNVRLIGPGSAGFMLVGEATVGIIPSSIRLRGGIGIIARGGSLLYHVATLLQNAQLGMSVLISLGADVICGMSALEAFEYFEADANTERIIYLTDIDGHDEESIARFLRSDVSKPVVAMMAGRSLPASVSVVRRGLPGIRPDAAARLAVLERAGARIADYPEQLIPHLLNRAE